MLPRRWVLAVIGSVLIVGSTFISGVLVDKYERRANRAQEAASEAQTSYWQSVANLDSAQSGVMESATQLLISFTFPPEIAELATPLQSEAKKQIVEDLELAAGPDVDKELITNLRASASDDSGSEEFLTGFGELTSYIREYQSQLLQDRVELEKEARSAEQSASTARSAAIFLQLIGLVLLLLREVPEKSLAKKDQKPSSTS